MNKRAIVPKIEDLVRYFLWLGTTGFGGPVVLANQMERELVTKRGWYSADEYKEGVALAQMAKRRCPRVYRRADRRGHWGNSGRRFCDRASGNR